MAVERKMPSEMQAALERVEALERLTTHNALQHALDLHKRTTHLRAAHIFAKKELEAGETEERIEVQGNVTEKTQLNTEIDELGDALLNHQLARFSLQKLAHKIQIQEAVSSSMINVDLEEPVANFPQKEALITHLTNNANTSSELASVIKEKQELDMDILELRVKYTQLIKDIKRKWTNTKDIQVHKPAVTETEKALETKVKDRDSRLLLMVSVIQGLICNSGITWGAFGYFRMLLSLCDTIIRSGSREDHEKTIQRLPKLKEDLERNKKEEDEEDEREVEKYPSKSRKPYFYTSTPARM